MHALQWPLSEINMYYLKTGQARRRDFLCHQRLHHHDHRRRRTVPSEGFSEPARSPDCPHLLGSHFFDRRAGSIALPNQFRTTVPTLEGLLKSTLFIPSLEPKAPLLLLGWTLNFEIFFYLMFASLFFLTSGLRTIVLLVLFAVPRRCPDKQLDRT